MRFVYYIMVATLSLVLLSASCKKEKYENPVDGLPAETKEGKNTIGCLVNGELVLPKKPIGRPSGAYQCYYQYVNDQFSKGYCFGLNVSMDGSKECEAKAVYVNLNAIEISSSPKTYKLGSRGEGKGSATFLNFKDCFTLEQRYSTSEEVAGELRITHFGNEKSIVSGTFWFDAVNPDGEKVEVREGRFDMNFQR